MVLSRHAEKLLGRTEDGIFEGPRVKSWFHIETVTLKGMFLIYSACQMACIDDFIEVALLHIDLHGHVHTKLFPGTLSTKVSIFLGSKRKFETRAHICT